MNKNNLNRIKGILSAKQGTQIPKFQGGFVIYHKSTNQPLYSKDGTSWFTDEDYMSPFTGSLNEFTEPELGQQFYTKNSNVTISGQSNTTPSNTTPSNILDSSIVSNALNNIQSTQNSNKPYNFIQNPINGIQGITNFVNHNGLAIPGGIDTDVNASVKSAANINKQIAQETQDFRNQKIARENVIKLPTTSTADVLNSMNEPFTPPTRNASPVETNLKLSKEDRQLSRQMHIEEKVANISPEKEENWNKALNVMDGISQIGNAVGAAQMATDSDTTKTATAVYDGLSNAISKAGPYGKIISGAMQAGKAIGDIAQWAGGGTDQQTKTDQWMDSPFFSWNVGLINGFAGKNTDSFSVDQDVLSQVGSSYGGAAANISEAAETADKKYGLFSSKARKKANEAIAKAKSDQNLMGDIADTASDQRLLVSSMGEQAGLAYSMMTDGGYNQKYTYAAKEGGILEWNPQIELKWEPLIELNWELPKLKEGGNIDIVEELEWIPEFKSGGKTEKFDIPEIEETNQKNVIPEGALHKNKHHMEHAEGLTKKGIPVIDEEGEQQAEIEHSEIIFTLEVTKKLEEYYQIFYSEESTNKEKEQAALDAGKLLVYQILENTEDRTGLIDSCKKGGTLTLKKSTDDLIEEVLEWIPNITIIEEVVEEKPKKESKKSEKEQMKEAIKEVLIEMLTK